MNKENGYFKTDVSEKFLHREIYYKHYPTQPRYYDVHHIDGNKQNNKITNLIAIPRELHDEIHKRMKCGEVFNKSEIELIYQERRLAGALVIERCVREKDIWIAQAKAREKKKFLKIPGRPHRKLKTYLSKYSGRSPFIISLKEKVLLGGLSSLSKKQIECLFDSVGLTMAEVRELERKKTNTTYRVAKSNKKQSREMFSAINNQ